MFDWRMKLLGNGRAANAALGAILGFMMSNQPLAGAESAAAFFVYAGTYTGPQSKGIHLFRLEAATGALTPLGLTAEITNPTFLALHPKQPFLYSISEVGGAKGGGVTAFKIDPRGGGLTQLNQQSTGGNGPCHLSVDKSGRCVLVANYGGGSIAALPIREDGALGEATAFIQHQGSSVNPQRQKGPHAHWIDVDPNNRFAYVCDLGLDKILIYRLDPVKGVLSPNQPGFAAAKPGAGPRHLAFHPNGRFAYVINELGNTMTAYAVDDYNGALTAIGEWPTLPPDFTGKNTTAEVEVHPSGKFVYGSNRGHDSLVVYAVDEQTGKLSLVQHQSSGGKSPRNFAIDPTGRWLIAGNQASANLAVFKIDPANGRLSPTGQSFDVGAVCLKYLPVLRAE